VARGGNVDGVTAVTDKPMKESEAKSSPHPANGEERPATRSEASRSHSRDGPATTLSAVKISLQGLTDQGRIRRNNEDSLAACDLSSGEVRMGPFAFDTTLGTRGLLFLVADGMGGQACGELASRMCSEQLPARLLEAVGQRPTVARGDLCEAISRAFEAANRSILEASRADLGCHGMGTTATAALLHDRYLLVAQVGDSRAYLIRNGQLLQLTRDQTFLNYLLEIGAVEASTESNADPRRSVLTQAVGTVEDLQVALTGIELCRGDRLLLASDGLYSMVPAPQVLRLAASGSDLSACGLTLIQAANEHGGADNITVILAEISGDSLPHPYPDQPVQVDDLSTKA
jgi:serine/threonine protein phosphatase PrpC